MVPQSALTALARQLTGRLLLPADGEYDQARRVFNAMIDRRPLAIAQCANAADAAACVRWAREKDVPVSIRSGGHNVAGSAVRDGALMIDLSQRKTVEVDPQARVARAQTGQLLGDLDRATAAYGLVTPLGVVSKTGIAGLTLGGGYGWLSGKYGLACDNVISAEVVTADGRILTASESENADLLWALRGAGANFGVVTRLDYRLYPLESLFAGLVIYSAEKAREVLRFFRELCRTATDELTAVAVLGPAPDGTPIAAIVVAYCGTTGEEERLRRRFAEPATPLADLVQRTRHVEFQSALDAGYPPGRYHYWKAAFLSALGDDALEVAVECFARRPSPLSVVMLEHWHGAAMRVSPEAAAFPHRQERFNFGLLGTWLAPEETAKNREWIREHWNAIQPHTLPRTYVNYLSEGEERVEEAYGPNYARLAQLKARYDPTNFFRANQNIRPAGSGASARAD
jgi:FAD/FMN-containing dehydrogenase